MELIDILSKPEVIWFLIGLAFLFLELLIPGVVIMFFGIGAWVTSTFILLFDIGLNYQLALFIGTSIVSLVLLRKFMKTALYGKKQGRTKEILEEFIGKTAVAKSEIKQGSIGQIKFKGSNWEAVSDLDINEGETVKIIGRDSIVMRVTPINIEKPEEIL